MIGGVVIFVSVRGERTCLWCAERLYDGFGNRAGIGDECGVYVDLDGEIPSVGDDVWWQCGKVYWTPEDERFHDRPLRKIGYSGSSQAMMNGSAALGSDPAPPGHISGNP
jgi:hypothetical protein